MAVKGTRKVTEGEAAEMSQEAPEVPQEAPEEEKVGKITLEPQKPQESPQESKETLVYVGPSLPRGLLKQNSIFVGTRTEIEKNLEEATKKYPMAGKMLVPVSQLAEAKIKIASKGNILHKYYADIVSLINESFKE